MVDALEARPRTCADSIDEIDATATSKQQRILACFFGNRNVVVDLEETIFFDFVDLT